MTEIFISTTGTALPETADGTIDKPYSSLSEAITANPTATKINFRQGCYKFDEYELNNFSGTSGSNKEITAYVNENVIFDGTRSITELADSGEKWTLISNQNVINDSNQLVSGSIYRIKLQNTVEIWQLFHGLNEIIGARYPSAQWSDNSVFSHDYWGHGYYNPSNPAEYNNGEIIDFPHGNINLKTWTDTVISNINSGFDITNSMINLNVGSYKTFTKKVNSMTLDNINNKITLAYDTVPLWKEKHHYYYLEGKLEYLNSPNEYFFDNSTKYLYLWMTGNEDPSSQNIRAKVQSYNLNIKNCDYFKLSKINFFGSTIRINNSSYVEISNCNFYYPSCYAHMIGQINKGTTFVPTQNEVFTTMTTANSSTNCKFYQCVFKYIDGSAIELFGGNNTIEDCYFNRVDKTVANLSSVMTTLRMGGSNNIFKNNTIHKTGASSTTNTGELSIVEYNDLSDSGFLQSDGALFHFMVAQQTDVKVRFNWAHDSIKYGIRFDGEGSGNQGYIHHNVIWNCEGGIMVKGGELSFNSKITNITQANPAVITVESSTGLTDGDQITISGVSGMTEVNEQNYYALIIGNNISLYSDTALTTPIDSSTFTAYSKNGWVSSGNSVGGHFIYNNTVMNAPTKNDIICLNAQSGKLINYKSIVMNNLSESISGNRSSAEALAGRIYNSNNFIPTNVEDYLVNFSNKDFRPINDVNIVAQGDTTTTAAHTYVGDTTFNPGSGYDTLTQDIGALNYNSTLWRAGITWNSSSNTDEVFVNNNRLNLYTNYIGSAGGDPYIVTFNNILYKIDNISGYCRMLQGFINNKPIIINVEMKLDSPEIETDMNSWSQSLDVFKEINNSYNTRVYRQSFFTKVFLSFGNSILIFDLDNFKIIAREGKNILFNRLNSFKSMLPMYKYEEVSNVLEVHCEHVSIYFLKYKNKQIRNEIVVAGGNHIKKANGFVVKPMRTKTCRINKLKNTKFFLNEKIKSNTFKKNIKETFHACFNENDKEIYKKYELEINTY